jgi:hypothetical protein
MAGPFKGRVHDGRMFRESGWGEIMPVEGLSYKLFGDSAFAMTSYVQAMIKNVGTADDRTFNALISRIRIHIEMAFGGHRNIFTFLSFARGLKLGVKDVGRIYKVAWILTNMRATF